MDEAAALARADRVVAELRARPDPSAEADLLAELAQLCRKHPAVDEAYSLPEVLEDLGRAYERLGRVEDALASVMAAIEAGLRGAPDPRTVLGEINYRAGRREEAEKIWAAVRADTPDDWWLYNNVAFEKAESGEWDDALGWIDEGVRLALAAGDPDRVLGQMSALRHECLVALGLPDDELQERAESPAAVTRRPAGPVSAPPSLLRPSELDPSLPLPHPEPERDANIGLAWFPEREYARVLRRWPELAAEGGPAAGPTGPATHRAYCQAVEQQLVAYAGVGGGIVVVPLRIDAYLDWCVDKGLDDGASESRAQYAADRLRRNAADLIAWPPARKHDCWCGSGRRYKRCCGGSS